MFKRKTALLAAGLLAAGHAAADVVSYSFADLLAPPSASAGNLPPVFAGSTSAPVLMLGLDPLSGATILSARLVIAASERSATFNGIDLAGYRAGGAGNGFDRSEYGHIAGIVDEGTQSGLRFDMTEQLQAALRADEDWLTLDLMGLPAAAMPGLERSKLRLQIEYQPQALGQAPEPGSLALAAVALAGAGLATRRRRRSAPG